MADVAPAPIFYSTLHSVSLSLIPRRASDAERLFRRCISDLTYLTISKNGKAISAKTKIRYVDFRLFVYLSENAARLRVVTI